MPQPPHLVVENTLVNDLGSIPLELGGRGCGAGLFGRR